MESKLRFVAENGLNVPPLLHKQIGPLKEYYAKKGILDEINGEVGSAAACINAVKTRLAGQKE